MRPFLVLVLLTGCDKVFSTPFDEDGNVDAGPDAPSCIAGTFAAPVEVPGMFQLGTLVDPTFASPRELWTVPSVSPQALHVSTRTSEGEPFDTIEKSLLDTPQSDSDPTFSADGKAIAFSHDALLYTATRDSAEPGTPFGLTMETAIYTTYGIDLSADGLLLYFVDPQEQLRMAGRGSYAERFAEAPQVLATGVRFPSISADHLELFYMHTDGAIHRRVRSAMEEVFENDQVVFDNAGDPDISVDGTTLVFSRQRRIMTAVRACP